MIVAVVGLFLFYRAPTTGWALTFMIVFSLTGIVLWISLFTALVRNKKE